MKKGHDKKITEQTRAQRRQVKRTYYKKIRKTLRTVQDFFEIVLFGKYGHIDSKVRFIKNDFYSFYVPFYQFL